MGYAHAAVASLQAQFADGTRPDSLPAAPSLADSLPRRAGFPKTLLKFLDEYLHAKHTKDWPK